MKPQEFLTFMHTIEALKCHTRHSWTSTGRHESVAEHSYRLSVMALLCRDAYPELDMDRVLRMCLVHDFGEAITGDIPSFHKTESDEQREDRAVEEILRLLPSEMREDYRELFAEIRALKTPEAKLYKALDNMEAVISHNEAPIDTWIPMEYKENLVYGAEAAESSPWAHELRALLRKESEEKLKRELNTQTDS